MNSDRNLEARTSLRDLVGGLADDAGSLVRGEIMLARTELEQKTTRVITGLVTLFGAMLLAYSGLIMVLIAVAQALTYVIPAWAASLVVGCIILAIGGMLVMSARKALAPSELTPQRTVSNVQADARVVKEHAR